MVDDILIYGLIGTLAVAGTYAGLYLYCDSKKGTAFCKFPCEPIIGVCAEKTVRVRRGEKV